MGFERPKKPTEASMARALERHIPTKVEQAKKAGDVVYLRAAGRKGGRKTAEVREMRAEYAKHLKEGRVHEDFNMRRSANEHIVPVDPERADDE